MIYQILIIYFARVDPETYETPQNFQGAHQQMPPVSISLSRVVSCCSGDERSYGERAKKPKLWTAHAMLWNSFFIGRH